MMALTAVLPGRGFRIEVLPDDNLDRLESLQFCGAVAIGADPAAFKDWGVRFPPSLVLIDREAAPGSRNVSTSTWAVQKAAIRRAIGSSWSSCAPPPRRWRWVASRCGW